MFFPSNQNLYVINFKKVSINLLDKSLFISYEEGFNVNNFVEQIILIKFKI